MVFANFEGKTYAEIGANTEFDKTFLSLNFYIWNPKIYIFWTFRTQNLLNSKFLENFGIRNISIWTLYFSKLSISKFFGLMGLKIFWLLGLDIFRTQMIEQCFCSQFFDFSVLKFFKLFRLKISWTFRTQDFLNFPDSKFFEVSRLKIYGTFWT